MESSFPSYKCPHVPQSLFCKDTATLELFWLTQSSDFSTLSAMMDSASLSWDIGIFSLFLYYAIFEPTCLGHRHHLLLYPTYLTSVFLKKGCNNPPLIWEMVDPTRTWNALIEDGLTLSWGPAHLEQRTTLRFAPILARGPHQDRSNHVTHLPSLVMILQRRQMLCDFTTPLVNVTTRRKAKWWHP